MNIKELNQELKSAWDNYALLKDEKLRTEQVQSSIMAAWHNIKKSAQTINFDLRGANDAIIQPMMNDLSERLNDLNERTKSAKRLWMDLNEQYQAKREQIEQERLEEEKRLKTERVERALSDLSTEQLMQLLKDRGVAIQS